MTDVRAGPGAAVSAAERRSGAQERRGPHKRLGDTSLYTNGPLISDPVTIVMEVFHTTRGGQVPEYGRVCQRMLEPV